MEEISLREIYYIVKKRMGIIIILFILSILISGFVSYYVLDEVYEASTTLMVGKPKDYLENNKIEYNELLINQRLVSTYGELVKTRKVADRVVNNIDLPYSSSVLKDKLRVSLIKDTEIISITVSDGDPELAAIIANETAQVFMESVRDIMRVENVQVIDIAQAPSSPVKPRPAMNVAIAGILGIMLGVFIIFLLEFLDTTIKTPEDVERHLGLTVIGSIPKVGD
jgi:capsular polysaccharide biosynthesis protein